MKTTSFFLMLLVAALPLKAVGQNKTFDIVNFIIPADWKVIEQPGMVALERTDQPSNTYCQIIIYSSQPSTGDVATDLAAEWKNIVEANATTETAPLLSEPQRAGGQSVATAKAYANTRTGSYRSFNFLSVFRTTNREIPIMIKTSLEESLKIYLPEIETFFKNLQFIGPTAATPSSSTSTSIEEVTLESLAGKWGISRPDGRTYQRYEFRPDGTWKYASKAASNTTFAYIELQDEGTFTLSDGFVVFTSKDGTTTRKRVWIENSNGAVSLCVVLATLFDGLNGSSTHDYKQTLPRL